MYYDILFQNESNKIIYTPSDFKLVLLSYAWSFFLLKK
jgi:hypothetical protein